MKRFAKTWFSSVKFVLLILLPRLVKMENVDEYCRPEDSTNVAVPFRPLHKGTRIPFRFFRLVQNIFSNTVHNYLFYNIRAQLEIRRKYPLTNF